MIKKQYKLFGIVVLTIVTYDKDEAPPPSRMPFTKPQGEVLEYSPEEEQRDRDKKIINKMEGK